MILLVMDGNNLAWRCHHTFGDLRYNDKPVGVLYGFLHELVYLKKQLHATTFALCFDHGANKRKQLSPSYKHRDLTPEQVLARTDVMDQLRILKAEILPRLGFRNVFSQDGYEADDVIARVCASRPYRQPNMVVSNDKDLLQVLTPDTSIWNYKRVVDYYSFHDQYGILARQWADVLALAGCAGDGVKGIKGVGEITAVQYLRGLLPKTSARYQKILEGQDVYRCNLPLVTLPLPGVKLPQIKEDELCPTEWDKVCNQFGLGTLAGLCPVGGGRGRVYAPDRAQVKSHKSR